MSTIKFANKLAKKYAIGGWSKDPAPAHTKELPIIDEKAERIKDIHNQIIAIKKLADQINNLYVRSTNDGIVSAVLTHIYDINYHATMRELGKIQSSLTKLIDDLTSL